MFTPCTQTEEATFDHRYRTSLVMSSWALPMLPYERIKQALTVGTRLSDGRIQVDKLEIFGPRGLPPEMKQHSKNVDDWGVRVTWRKIAQGTPVLVLAGAVIAVITAVVAAWLIVAKFTEKELLEVNQEIRRTLKDTLFNPGFIVAAMVVAVLYLRRK